LDLIILNLQKEKNLPQNNGKIVNEIIKNNIKKLFIIILFSFLIGKKKIINKNIKININGEELNNIIFNFDIKILFLEINLIASENG
jgi:hypothetical protein